MQELTRLQPRPDNRPQAAGVPDAPGLYMQHAEYDYLDRDPAESGAGGREVK
jgi:hypothetical protein